MTTWHALLLGIIQGLTEFLPVSSSTHMLLCKKFLGISGENQVLFDLMCHFGTLIASLTLLRREILSLFTKDRETLLSLFLALLPLVPCYFLFGTLRSHLPVSSSGFFLLLSALFLFSGHHFQLPFSPERKTTSAFLIGVMQSLALFPGISRSASTISSARLLGWDAKEAVRFSFLLAIPTIIGGNTLELIKIAVQTNSTFSISPQLCLIGFGSSMCVGLLVFPFALKILEKGKLLAFAIYCAIIGTLLLLAGW